MSWHAEFGGELTDKLLLVDLQLVRMPYNLAFNNIIVEMIKLCLHQIVTFGGRFQGTLKVLHLLLFMDFEEGRIDKNEPDDEDHHTSSETKERQKALSGCINHIL